MLGTTVHQVLHRPAQVLGSVECEIAQPAAIGNEGAVVSSVSWGAETSGIVNRCPKVLSHGLI